MDARDLGGSGGRAAGLAPIGLMLGLALLPVPAAGREPPSAPAAPVVVELGNGMKATVAPVRGSGIVVVRGRLEAGSIYDGDRPGLSALAQALLALPVVGEAPDHPTLHWTLDDDPTAFTNFRWIEFRASARPESLPSLLEALAGRLRRAVGDDPRTFPEIQLDWLRRDAMERSQRLGASDASAFWSLGLERLYPSGSPLASPPWGTPTGLARVRVRDVIEFLKERAAPRSARIVVAGDVDVASCLAVLQGTLGRVGPGTPARARESVPGPRGPRSWTSVPVRRGGRARDTVVVVWPGERSGPMDALAARALASLLGTPGQPGLLEEELVQPGLALSATASLEEEGAPGFYLIIATAGRGQGRAVAGRIREVIETLVRGTLGEADLARWRKHVAETESQHLSDPAALARSLLGSGASALRPAELSLAALNDAARRFLKRGAPVVHLTASGDKSPPALH